MVVIFPLVAHLSSEDDETGILELLRITQKSILDQNMVKVM